MSLERSRRRRAPVVGLGIALGLMLATTVAGPAAAANNIVIQAFFGDCQFAGIHAGASKAVKVEWRDSDGNLKSKHSVTSNSAGSFVTRCEPDELIEKGDVLKTTIGTSSRSITVPKLTAVVDRDTDQVTGTVSPAPFGDLDVVLWTSVLSFSRTAVSEDFATVTNGTYATTTWGGNDHSIGGWDEVYVYWSNSRGDEFVRYAVAEGLRVWLRQQFVQRVGNPGDDVDITLYDAPAGNAIAELNGRLNRNGTYSGDFLDADGDPLRLAPGNQIVGSFANNATFVVENITASINKTTDKVTIDCGGTPTGAFGALVVAHTRDGTKSQLRSNVTDNFGVFLANFSTTPKYDLKSGDKVDVYCKLTTGDQVARTFTVP